MIDDDTARERPGPHAATPAGKPQARALGIPFDGTPGPWNAITDVPGLEVGYATLIEGDSVRTGSRPCTPGAPRAPPTRRGSTSPGRWPGRSPSPTPTPFGLARTGTTGSHLSGDLFLAFSTGNPRALMAGAADGANGDLRVRALGARIAVDYAGGRTELSGTGSRRRRDGNQDVRRCRGRSGRRPGGDGRDPPRAGQLL